MRGLTGFDTHLSRYRSYLHTLPLDTLTPTPIPRPDTPCQSVKMSKRQRSWQEVASHRRTTRLCRGLTVLRQMA